MTYSQNFNSLGTGSSAWVDDATIPGWHAQINNGLTSPGAVQASNGTLSGMAGLLNLGMANDPDRALGSKAASAGDNANIAYAVQFRNASDSPVRFTGLTYTGELWRSNSSSGGRAETYTLYYMISPAMITDIKSGASSAFPDGGDGFHGPGPATEWTSPNNLPRDSPRNGNDPANRTTVSWKPGPLIVYPGWYLVLKWTDTNLAGNDGYQGLDDVSVEFTSLAGVPGVVDTGFNPKIGGKVHSIVTQADGNLVIAGFFDTAGGEERIGLARLLVNGALDVQFNPLTNDQTHFTLVQTGGKLVIGGDF